MMQKLQLPELGENITSGTITRVLVKVGDTIAVNQPVLEMETEKAVVEVPSTVAGKVTEIRVKERQIIDVGEIILLVSTEEVSTGKSEQAPAQPPTAAKQKAATEQRKQKPGSARAEKPAASAPDSQTEKWHPPAVLWEPTRHPVLAAPSVRRLARELGIDINEVEGSGPAGRISADDVRAFALEHEKTPENAFEAESIPTPESPEPENQAGPGHSAQDKWGEIKRVPMSAIRRKTAQHVSEAWRTIPQVTHFDHADATLLESFRNEYASRVEKAGGKLTITVILAKIVAVALRRFPQFNSVVDIENEQIILKDYIHIGIAVDTKNGLLVPVIRNADRKSMHSMAVEITGLAERARQRKLDLEEMQGGTFTITNLGGIGGDNFTPIINAPEVAILGVSRTRIEPVYKEGKFEPRLMLPLALSYDHRVIDGADAARFTRFIVEAIEQPFTMLMENAEL